MSWKDNLQETSPAYLLASSDAPIIRAVAGPGSGKSFAIKKRILRLLEDGVAPEEILAITFTRTAAHDLRQEISALGLGAENVHIRTVHSHALKILMKTDVLESTGRNPRMVIEHEITPSLTDIDLSFSSTLSQKRKLLDAYLAGWAVLQEDSAAFTQTPEQAEFESKLIIWLVKHKGLLVGEVIPVAIKYLRNNPMESEIGKYHTVLVDEYQDLNKSEQEFIKLIKGKSNIVIVGDDDQSIYGFKFAHPEGIQEVDITYGDYDNIIFDECRRCPQQVTRMASALIEKNPNRTLGPLVPATTNPEGIVDIVQWGSLDEEIAGISNLIKKELDGGIINPQDILVLTPRRLIGYKLRESLTNLGVNVKSYFREDSMTAKGGLRPAYSLMNLAANKDDFISLRFLLGEGSANNRKSQYAKLTDSATSNGISIFEVLNKIIDGSLTVTSVREIVNKYKDVIQSLASLKRELMKDPINGFSNLFIHNDEDRFNFYELQQVYLKALLERNINGTQTEEQFNDWFPKVFATIQDNISTPEVPEHVDHVRIMSLHASKGLGAKLVILSSMVDPLIPFRQNNIPVAELERVIEEQRRLFYVALTRCKSSDSYDGRLVISTFKRIVGVEALKMGLGPVQSVSATYAVRSSRYLEDFDQTSPAPIRGSDL